MSESKKIDLNIQAVLDALNNPANQDSIRWKSPKRYWLQRYKCATPVRAQRHSHSNRSARRESFRRANSNMGDSR